MLNGGEQVGEATSNARRGLTRFALSRLYGHWPPRLLIADEVGLSKNDPAGMLIRRRLGWREKPARAHPCPGRVCRHWQLEHGKVQFELADLRWRQTCLAQNPGRNNST
jgi:hypothetical protein